MSAIIPTTEEIQRDYMHAMLNPGSFDCLHNWYSGLLTAIPDGIASIVLKTDCFLAKYLGYILYPIEDIVKKLGFYDTSNEWINGEIRKDTLLRAYVTPNCYASDLATFVFHATEVAFPIILFFIVLTYILHKKRQK
ncbi:hypothetical protein GTB52_001217 [Salmonella enterica]|nr:hypothetical protein [Salmonella enterica]